MNKQMKVEVSSQKKEKDVKQKVKQKRNESSRKTKQQIRVVERREKIER